MPCSTIPAQLARVEPLAEAVRARMKHSSELIDLRRAGGIEAVQQRLAQTHEPARRRLQSRIRALAQEMKVAEIELLNERERDAQRSAQVTQSVIVGGSVLALMFVALALYAIRRDFAGRARAEAELNRFFDLSIDLFAIASADGYFKRMSPAVTDMLGYTMEEALALDYMEMHASRRSRAHRRGRSTRRSIAASASRISSRGSATRTAATACCRGARCRRGGLMYATARDVTDARAPPRRCARPRSSSRCASSERTRELAPPTNRCARASGASARSSSTAPTASR